MPLQTTARHSAVNAPMPKPWLPAGWPLVAVAALWLVGCSSNLPRPSDAKVAPATQSNPQPATAAALPTPAQSEARTPSPSPATPAANAQPERLPDTATAPDAPTAADKATPAAGEVFAKGRASWYGPGFHGRRTASGERFDMHALTAAHKTLPFGSRVRVRSVHTGKEVVVRINDRGPYAHRRIIDLSYAAANALGVRHRGVTEVVLLRE